MAIFNSYVSHYQRVWIVYKPIQLPMNVSTINPYRKKPTETEAYHWLVNTLFGDIPNLSQLWSGICIPNNWMSLPTQIYIGLLHDFPTKSSICRWLFPCFSHGFPEFSHDFPMKILHFCSSRRISACPGPPKRIVHASMQLDAVDLRGSSRKTWRISPVKSGEWLI